VARKEINLKGYETICILHPDLTEEEVQGTIESYSALISENGGEVTKSDHWGLRKLAYSVQGHPRGHYIYLLYTGAAETIAELERNLRILDQNIRYMTIKVDDVEEAAKAKPQLLEDPTLAVMDGGRDG
jgi:small subunit ribosomal protein S6